MSKHDDGGEMQDATLLDYFAGQATEEYLAVLIPATNGGVQALMVSLDIRKDKAEPTPDLFWRRDLVRVRTWARYEFAAAMIAERRRREGAEK